MFHKVLRVFRDVLLVVHDVLLVVHDVLLVVYNVSQCFRSVSWWFTMFNNASQYLASLAMSGIAASTTTDHRGNRDNAAGITTTLQGSAIATQKSAMTPQRSLLLPRKWSHAKLKWRLEQLCSWKTNSKGNDKEKKSKSAQNSDNPKNGQTLEQGWWALGNLPNW